IISKVPEARPGSGFIECDPDVNRCCVVALEYSPGQLEVRAFGSVKDKPAAGYGGVAAKNPMRLTDGIIGIVGEAIPMSQLSKVTNRYALCIRQSHVAGD